MQIVTTCKISCFIDLLLSTKGKTGVLALSVNTLSPFQTVLLLLLSFLGSCELLVHGISGEEMLKLSSNSFHIELLSLESVSFLNPVLVLMNMSALILGIQLQCNHSDRALHLPQDS